MREKKEALSADKEKVDALFKRLEEAEELKRAEINYREALENLNEAKDANRLAGEEYLEALNEFKNLQTAELQRPDTVPEDPTSEEPILLQQAKSRLEDADNILKSTEEDLENAEVRIAATRVELEMRKAKRARDEAEAEQRRAESEAKEESKIYKPNKTKSRKKWVTALSIDDPEAKTDPAPEEGKEEKKVSGKSKPAKHASSLFEHRPEIPKTKEKTKDKSKSATHSDRLFGHATGAGKSTSSSLSSLSSSASAASASKRKRKRKNR